MRKSEYLKMKDKESGRIIPSKYLPEFCSILKGLGYNVNDLLDENDDMYVHVYEAPTTKDYPYPTAEQQQLARDLARRDNAFLRKIQDFGDTYLKGYMNEETGTFLSFAELNKAVDSYLMTCEKFDYARITPIPNKKWYKRLLFGRHSGYGEYYYCEWSVWLRTRVHSFMQKAIAYNLLHMLRDYYENYDEKERLKNEWKNFTDFLKYNAEMEALLNREKPVDYMPYPYYEVKKYQPGMGNGKGYAYLASGGDLTVGKDGMDILEIDRAVEWKKTCMTEEEVINEIYKFLEREKVQPSYYNQGFFRLSSYEQKDVIERAAKEIYKWYIDVDYMSPLDIWSCDVDDFWQEGAELHGGMHALK